MGLSTLQRLAYRLLGGRANNSKQRDKLDEQLRRAQISVRAEAYLATAWFISIIVTVSVTIVGVSFFSFLVFSRGLSPVYGILLLVLPGFVYYISNIAILSGPGSIANKRRKSIDARLPYAANYVTAMASAGVIPAEIFKSLASQEVYGEVARESAWIYKDLEMHGMDVVTAMRRAIARSPSERFRDLMQGAITTVTSGGDLTGYFEQKARRLQFDNRLEQNAFIETMGLMAEAYVTAAVAGPLFLLVMVAIFVLMGAGEFFMLQLLIYLLLPVANIGFMFGLKSMIPEV